MTIEVELGRTTERGGVSNPAMMDVEELLATRLLVQGNSGSGKSHLLRRLLEQSAPMVQQCIVDPEGDFVSLAERYGHIVINAERSETELETIAARVRQHRTSVVLDLSSLDVDLQMKAAAHFLNGLFDQDREHWHPMLVVVDEAQLFAPAAAGEVSDEARKLSLGAMTNLMCRGRKRGLAGVIATQRLAKLAKNVAAEASNFLMGRTFLDIDMARAAELLGMDRKQAEMFRELGRGNFVALGPALSRKPLPIQVGSVETRALGSTPKLTPPPSGEDVRDLILAPMPVTAKPTLERRPTPPPPPSMNDLLAQVVRARQATETSDPAVPAMTEEDRESVLTEIINDILAEPGSSGKPQNDLYRDFSLRCRIRKVGGEPVSIAEFKRRLMLLQGGEAASEDDEWKRAVDLAETMGDEYQGAFMLLAKAAMKAEPCPSDMDVAQVLGSMSPGRGRKKIESMEAMGVLTIRLDIRKRRIVAIPELGWETRPGDPRAPAGAGALAAAG